MKSKCVFGLLLSLAFGAGCVAPRSPEVPSAPPEPLASESLEDELITIEGGEAIAGLRAEVETPAPERQNLSWEEIKALGFEYEVRSGDTLSAIATEHKVGSGLLTRLNDIENPNLIRVGQKLTVVEGLIRLEVDKSDKILSVYLGDKFIRSYPVGTGKKDSTPEGKFEVVRKLMKPPWTDPYHRTIVRADDPQYPLGTRWIEFIPPPGAYGIHGTNNAEEIGQEVSFGCVRVLHPQEEEIYDFVTLGSPVMINP